MGKSSAFVWNSRISARDAINSPTVAGRTECSARPCPQVCWFFIRNSLVAHVLCRFRFLVVVNSATFDTDPALLGRVQRTAVTWPRRRTREPARNPPELHHVGGSWPRGSSRSPCEDRCPRTALSHASSGRGRAARRRSRRLPREHDRPDPGHASAAALHCHAERRLARKPAPEGQWRGNGERPIRPVRWTAVQLLRNSASLLLIRTVQRRSALWPCPQSRES